MIVISSFFFKTSLIWAIIHIHEVEMKVQCDLDYLSSFLHSISFKHFLQLNTRVLILMI